jgi:hypothetical protein
MCQAEEKATNPIMKIQLPKVTNYRGDTEGFATTRQKRPGQSHHLHHQHIKGNPTKQAKDP